jgi:hypothetical protein
MILFVGIGFLLHELVNIISSFMSINATCKNRENSATLTSVGKLPNTLCARRLGWGAVPSTELMNNVERRRR